MHEKPLPTELIGKVSEAEWQTYCMVSHHRFSAIARRVGATGAGGKTTGPAKRRSFEVCSKAGKTGGPLGAARTNALRREQQVNRLAALKAVGRLLANEIPRQLR